MSSPTDDGSVLESATADDNEQVDKAVDVIARRVIARLSDEVAEEWENYPEIGEMDWRAVVDRVAFLSGELNPDHLDFQNAYQLLTDRAEEWA